MNRQYLHITVTQGEHGYDVIVSDARARIGYSGAGGSMPPLAEGKHLDADAAAATVGAALEGWTQYEEKQGWTREE